DRDVLGSVVGTSDDQGRSWTHRSVTAIAASPELVRTAFPTSGAGIQLRRGEHAGRQLQPYCGSFWADGRPGEQQVGRAYVLCTDVHGRTWQRGDSVGRDRDETTSAELSDGRVLLNSRAH